MNQRRLACATLTFALLAQLGCGARLTDDATRVATGGSGNSVAATGGQPSRECANEEPVNAPSLADTCTVLPVALDPNLLCGAASCPITRMLDLDCQTLQFSEPQIAASTDRAWVLIQSRDDSIHLRLLTVTTGGSQVQELTAPLVSDALAADTGGTPWLFGETASGIGTLREATAGWQGATVLTPNGNSTHVTSADIVDDHLGYFTFTVNNVEPHLATWNGSCWNDEKLWYDTSQDLVVKTDAHNRPWVAWEPTGESPFIVGIQSVNVRGPEPGMADEQFKLPSAIPTNQPPSLRLLPGGLDRTAMFPTVAMRLKEGINLFAYEPAVDSHWVAQVLTDSAPATATGDCPDIVSQYQSIPCRGLTSCQEQVSGAGSRFDLVQTPAGNTYAAWLEYTSNGSYDLAEFCYGGGEMGPTCACPRTETSGTATTDLVVARLTHAEPVLTRFRLYTGDIQISTQDGIALAVRGDTLVLATIVNRRDRSTLRYLELDSTQLP